MKKYNIQNYIRYKADLKKSIADLEGKFYDEHTRNELIVRFLPLVENLGRKFSTAQQASGVLSINDIIQIGSEALVRAVDKLNWEVLHASEDVEKTLKSFFSKRIKGAIRRRIDMMRGDMRIPEHKINEFRKNPENKESAAIFFNAMFSSIDTQGSSDTSDVFSGYNLSGDESWSNAIPDCSKVYNIDLMNSYLLSIMKQYLEETEYEVLRLSYGLDCDKHKAKDIATQLNIKGTSSYVRVSEIKKQAIKKLIENVDPSQVIDYL